MPAEVTLQNGDTFQTDEDPQTLAERFDSAREDGTLIKVDAGNGPVWINPHALACITQREAHAPGEPLIARV